MAWVRLFRAEKPSVPGIFTDRRRTALVLIPGPIHQLCAGPGCHNDTGSDAAHWCSHDCHAEWNSARMNGQPS